MKRKIIAVSLMLVLVVTMALALTTGPNFPSTATGNTSVVGGGTGAWTSPTNIGAADSVFAAVVLNTASNAFSDDLIGTSFGFAIAGTDTINGILLEINYKSSLSGPTEQNVRLLKAGTATVTDRSTSATLPTASTTVSYGGAADLWGTTWTPSDINASNFGALAVYSTTVSLNRTISIDFFRITVTSTPAASGANSGFLKMFGFKIKPPQPHTQTRTLGLR